MNLPDRPQVRNDLLVEVVDEQVVVVDRKSAQVCHLNPTASLIWGNLNGTNELSVLVEQVCKAFEVEDRVAESDVKVFLSELMTLGLLV
jgi:hypothetical protein